MMRNRHRSLAATGALGIMALLFSFGPVRGADAPAKKPYTTWSDYGGAADSMQYSALRLVDKGNAGRLERAWFHPAPGPSGRFAFNPLIVDDVMYIVGANSNIVALEAATGRLLWQQPVDGSPTNRGFNYWESKDRSDRRLIFAANNYLRQINARTGEYISTFGRDGRVDLREGLPRARGVQSGTPGRVFENLLLLGSATGEGYNSAPGDLRAYDIRTGKLVWTFHTIPRPGEFGYDTWPKDAWKYVGGANTWVEFSIDEKRGIAYFPLGSPTHDMYGGDRTGANLFGNCLLALDARTGKRLWHFQAVHHDLWDYDLATGPKLLTVRHNGKMVDVVAQPTKLGLLYVFERVTGKPLWPIEERPVPKSDVPGEQAWPTQPFPTKPPPFSRLKFPIEDVNPYVDEEERNRLREVLRNARNEGIFTPPTLDREVILLPGQFGGTNWGGAAGDPETGMLYVRAVDLPTIHRLRPWDPNAVRAQGSTPAARGRSVYTQLCQVCHGEAQPSGIRSMDRASIINVKQLGPERVRKAVREGIAQMPQVSEARLSDQLLEALLAYLADPAAASPATQADEEQHRESAAATSRRDRIPPPPPMANGQVRYTGPLGSTFRAKNGMSGIGPPWTRIVAYDLNEGTIQWEAPLGTVPELAARGITDTGHGHRAHKNGLVVTAGGLIFVGSYGDRKVWAFDKETGKVLWQHELDANPEGIPAVYEVGGRQYIAFYASSSEGTGNAVWKPGKPGAQGYYVFALPKSAN